MFLWHTFYFVDPLIDVKKTFCLAYFILLITVCICGRFMCLGITCDIHHVLALICGRYSAYWRYNLWHYFSFVAYFLYFWPCFLVKKSGCNRCTMCTQIDPRMKPCLRSFGWIFLRKLMGTTGRQKLKNSKRFFSKLDFLFEFFKVFFSATGKAGHFS